MSDHEQPVAANLLARRFDAPGPNQLWVGDTTEFVIGGSGKLYLAAVLDLFLAVRRRCRMSPASFERKMTRSVWVCGRLFHNHARSLGLFLALGFDSTASGASISAFIIGSSLSGIGGNSVSVRRRRFPTRSASTKYPPTCVLRSTAGLSLTPATPHTLRGRTNSMCMFASRLSSAATLLPSFFASVV